MEGGHLKKVGTWKMVKERAQSAMERVMARADETDERRGKNSC